MVAISLGVEGVVCEEQEGCVNVYILFYCILQGSETSPPRCYHRGALRIVGHTCALRVCLHTCCHLFVTVLVPEEERRNKGVKK
jgi:hypothetical protein